MSSRRDLPALHALLRSMGARRAYAVESPLDPDAAHAALERHVDAVSVRSPMGRGSSPVLGRVTDGHVVVLARQVGRNAWSWTFHGSITPAAGSRLSGTVGAPRATMVAASVWCALCAVFLVALLVPALDALAGGVTGAHLRSVAGALVPLGFLVAFVGLARIATRDAARRWADVDASLRDWLDAEQGA